MGMNPNVANVCRPHNKFEKYIVWTKSHFTIHNNYWTLVKLILLNFIGINHTLALPKRSSYFDCLVVTIAALCLDMQEAILLECGGR